MASRLSLAVLAVASVAIPIVSFIDAAWAGWVFALLALTVPVALMTIGAARDRRVGTLGAIFLIVLALLAGSGVVMLSHAGAASGGRALLGLPLALVVFALGVWLVPFVITVAAYVVSFNRFGISDADLDRLRQFSARRDEA